MKIFPLIIFLFILNSQANCQTINYLSIRDSTFITADSSTLTKTIIRLVKYDTNSISKNIHFYFRDLGKSYQKLYQISNDTTFLNKAINNYNKALFHKPDYSSVLWDISFSYFLLGNCEMREIYLEKYKKITPRKSWDKKKIDLMFKICNDSKRNTIFFEFFGNAYFYSINYERLFNTKKKVKIAARAGLSYSSNFFDNEQKIIALPLEISALYPIFKKNSFIEVGTGLLYANFNFYYDNIVDNAIFLNSRIGYRFQKRNGGLFIKTGFTPLYTLYVINTHDSVQHHEWYLTGGLGIGYTF